MLNHYIFTFQVFFKLNFSCNWRLGWCRYENDRRIHLFVLSKNDKINKYSEDLIQVSTPPNKLFLAWPPPKPGDLHFFLLFLVWVNVLSNEGIWRICILPPGLIASMPPGQFLSRLKNILIFISWVRLTVLSKALTVGRYQLTGRYLFSR